MTYVWPLPGWLGPIDLHWGSNPGASDLMAPAGTPVVSVSDGTVTFAGYDSLGGNAVEIHGADGLDYYYAHMRSSPLVRAGQAIAAGTPLGAVGNTGDASGGPAHLHLGIGHGIQTGGGPAGGAGIGFDAVSFLRQLAAGRAGGSVPGLTPVGVPVVGGIGAAVSALTSRATWERLLLVAGGGLLLVIGLVLAFSPAEAAALRGAVRGAKVAAVAA